MTSLSQSPNYHHFHSVAELVKVIFMERLASVRHHLIVQGLRKKFSTDFFVLMHSFKLQL